MSCHHRCPAEIWEFIGDQLKGTLISDSDQEHMVAGDSQGTLVLYHVYFVRQHQNLKINTVLDRVPGANEDI